MPTPRRRRRLWNAYRVPGFQPSSTLIGIFGDPFARDITVTRRSQNGPRDLRPRVQRGWYWRAALKWQRLHPYEKFAAMIDRRWDGIAASPTRLHEEPISY